MNKLFLNKIPKTICYFLLIASFSSWAADRGTQCTLVKETSETLNKYQCGVKSDKLEIELNLLSADTELQEDICKAYPEEWFDLCYDPNKPLSLPASIEGMIGVNLGSPDDENICIYMEASTRNQLLHYLGIFSDQECQ